jgi:S-methylmethionine-dependent homocysteine/selenocysteine methylase
MTLDSCAEAIGITWAAHDVGLSAAISFTVETDGRIPGETSLATAIAEVDVAARPEYFMINCAHPSHMEPAFGGPGDGRKQGTPRPWAERILGVRYNASERSRAEVDESPDLDRGDIDALAAGHARLEPLLPRLVVVGGCCGTDASHVRRLWRAAQVLSGDGQLRRLRGTHQGRELLEFLA